MADRARVRCRCSAVEGCLADASSRSVNRVICYCADCQAFAHYLGRADLLDGHGGSDIVQVAPTSLVISRGNEHIAGLRLTPDGLFRFYARCCNTPLGNVLGPGLPFVGVIVQAFDTGEKSIDGTFGAPRGMIHGRYAVGGTPKGSTKFNLRLIARAVFLICSWRLTGRQWPHPFFDRRTRAPARPIAILTSAEREALRHRSG